MLIFVAVTLLSLLEVNLSTGGIPEISHKFISWVPTWEPLGISELFSGSVGTFRLGVKSPTLRDDITFSDVWTIGTWSVLFIPTSSLCILVSCLIG